MSPTYRILRLLNILIKPFRVMFLNQIHTFSIQFFDRLPDLTTVLVIVLELESFAPVTEIGGNDEDCIGIIEIGGKEFAVLLLHGVVCSSDHDGDKFEIGAETFVDEGEMHLETMLFVFVIRLYILELALVLQLVCNYITNQLLYLSTTTFPNGVCQISLVVSPHPAK